MAWHSHSFMREKVKDREYLVAQDIGNNDNLELYLTCEPTHLLVSHIQTRR
jgi:hypothetical protein